MKSRCRTLLPLALILVGASAAAGGDVYGLNSRDSVQGTVEDGVLEVVPVDVAEGTLLDVDLKMAAGSGADLDLLGPDRLSVTGFADRLSKDSKGRKARARKVPLTLSGRHYVIVRAAVPGDYLLKVKLKPLKKFGFVGFIAGDPPSEVSFGGAPGVVVTAKLSAAKKSGLAPKIAYLRAPSGDEVELPASGHKASLKYDQYSNILLDELGTHVIGLSTQTGQFGDYGVLKLKIKHPRFKPSKRTDGDLVVDPFVDTVAPVRGFDNLSYEGLAVFGAFFTPGASVRFEGEGGTIQASSTVRLTDGLLGFDVDLTGREPGSYDVVVSLPSGGEGRLADGFTVDPTPLPASITPDLAFENSTQPFVVTGSRFRQGLSVVVLPAAGGNGVSGVVGTVTDTTIAVSLPLLNAAQGAYDLVVTNPDGGTRTLAAALTVSKGPRINAADPLLGHDNDGDLTVTLSGNGYAAGMVVTLERGGEPPVLGATGALTASSCEATFDLRGLPAGDWTLRATNTDGGTITYATPFVVGRAPRIDSLSLSRGFQGESPAGVVATGSDFVAGAQAEFEQDASTSLSASGEVVGGGGTTLTMDLDLTAAPVGVHDLRVTNPDGGSELLVGPMTVLGRRSVATGVDGAGPPLAAWNAEDGEYLVAYSVTTSGQRDVRARRISGETGAPLGDEIAITSLSDDASGTEDQYDPAVVYVPSFSKDGDDFAGHWLVVYSWSDVNTTGDQTRVKFQLVNRDGTLNTLQENASTVFTSTSGALDRPRVAWNSARQEGLVVWGFDADAVPDVWFACLDKGFLFDGFRILGIVESGTLVADTHEATVQGETVDIADGEREPDVAWSPDTGEYLVSYGFNYTETGGPPPPADSGWDVRARFFDGDFSSGPVATGSLTNLGNVNGKNERRSSVAYDSATGRFLVAWDYDDGSGNRDLRAFLVNGSTRARVGSTPVTLEQTPSEDAARAAVAFDGTPLKGRWLVAHAVAPGVSGSSRIEVARIAPDGGAASGLGTPEYLVPAAAATGEAHDAPCVVPRGSGSELLGGWTTTGSGLDPAEIRITR